MSQQASQAMCWVLALIFLGLSEAFLLVDEPGIGGHVSITSELNCGNPRNLLQAISSAHQATSPQDAANRMMVLVDTYDWTQFCVQGQCKFENLGGLARHFYLESTIVEDWSFDNLRVKQGANVARTKFKLSLSDKCGNKYPPIQAEYLFYCNGMPQRATEIHVLYDEKDLIQMQDLLLKCYEDLQSVEIDEPELEPSSEPL